MYSSSLGKASDSSNSIPIDEPIKLMHEAEYNNFKKEFDSEIMLKDLFKRVLINLVISDLSPVDPKLNKHQKSGSPAPDTNSSKYESGKTSTSDSKSKREAKTSSSHSKDSFSSDAPNKELYKKYEPYAEYEKQKAKSSQRKYDPYTNTYKESDHSSANGGWVTGSGASDKHSSTSRYDNDTHFSRSSSSDRYSHSDSYSSKDKYSSSGRYRTDNVTASSSRKFSPYAHSDSPSSSTEHAWASKATKEKQSKTIL